MATRLTPEQERRIQTIVEAGAYHSAEEALDAAVAAVEIVSAPGFDGSANELEELLREGLDSGEAVDADDEFWKGIRNQTDAIAEQHHTRKLRP